jgi:hypothetical protein
MGRIRSFGVAVTLAAVMVMSSGTTMFAAKKPGGGGGGGKDGSVCEYLTAIITYEYTTPTIMTYALSLYSLYGCGA